MSVKAFEKASLITLAEFPTPQEIVSLGALAIMTRWKQDVKRSGGMKRANHLVQVAQASVGFTEGLMAAKFELRSLGSYPYIGK